MQDIESAIQEVKQNNLKIPEKDLKPGAFETNGVDKIDWIVIETSGEKSKVIGSVKVTLNKVNSNPQMFSEIY